MGNEPQSMPMVSQFDSATAVRTANGRRVEATIDPAWCLGQVPNGGYVLAIMLRAARTLAPSGDLMMLNGHFLTAPSPGPVDVEVSPIRLGRTVVRTEARLSQGGSEKVRMLTAFSGEEHSVATDPRSEPFDPPPLETCVKANVSSPDGREAPVRQHLDIRYARDSLGWLSGEPTGRALVQAWVRSAEGRPTDELMLPLVVDVLPAAVYDVGVKGWVPTVELTLHQIARPTSDWIFCRARARFVGKHAFVEDADVWDAAGRLVAVSRQHGLLPRRGSTGGVQH